MALPQHLAEFERRVAARLADAVEEMRRSMQAKAERASSQLLTEIEAYRPEIPERLLGESDLAGLERPSREATRGELARELLAALVALESAPTQGAALEALLAAARGGAERAALWLVQEDTLVGWGSVGFSTNGGDPLAGARLSYAAVPALARFARGRGTVRLAAGDAARLAAELEVGAPQSAALVPIVLRDRLAAALYVDRLDASHGEVEIELVQLLTHATAQRLELQGISSRAYSPTLVLDEQAPPGRAGLPLWNPDELGNDVGAPAIDAAEVAAPEPESASDFAEFELAAEAPAVSAPASLEDAAADFVVADELGAFELESAEEPSALAEPDFAAEISFEPESPGSAEPPPPMRPAAATFDAPPASPEAAPSDEIAWEMEEADSTVLMSRPGSTPAPDAGAVTGAIPRSLAAPDEAPPSARREILPDREVYDSTAEFLAPARPAEAPAAGPRSRATQEFPLPEDAARPGEETTADLSDDATVLVRRAATTEPPAPAVPNATVAIPVPSPASPAPALDDEPTISKAKSTEVAPPPDLQGPGWAFTASRTQRSTGENALHEEARRLARLLISEIKLYNEEQVEEGRRNRDVYHRLKEDIDRSRQIYEERIHDSVRGTTDYFQQELVRSLAGGDPRALGI